MFLFFADFGSQDCYDIPRSFPSDKSCSFDFNESFNSYFVSVASRVTSVLHVCRALMHFQVVAYSTILIIPVMLTAVQMLETKYPKVSGTGKSDKRATDHCKCNHYKERKSNDGKTRSLSLFSSSADLILGAQRLWPWTLPATHPPLFLPWCTHHSSPFIRSHFHC